MNSANESFLHTLFSSHPVNDLIMTPTTRFFLTIENLGPLICVRHGVDYVRLNLF